MECCLKKRILTIGNTWPNFTLKAVDINNNIITIDNESIKNKTVVFFFYPLDFTFVCPTELNQLNLIVKALAEVNGIIVTVSTDSVFSHQQWKKQLNNIDFVMGSDNNRHLSQKLGVLNEDGVCSRVTYIVENGVVKWLEVAPDNIGRDIPYILRNVQAITSGQMCPASWKLGDEFITT
jgi:peroxiredoxin (alkyl hydroperoxide reductase subunit C)